ncbi:archaea-specific SMC-related protein [Haloarcula litorea]|uniref:archaea-specific SMC-related protein n=1 Tax=Haloarcula litorea TaxID=3032579 RepID=UPI0023E8F3B2|nr:archaea-specific SMC-related protein [Halomicroarcula sp. GDY20]
MEREPTRRDEVTGSAVELTVRNVGGIASADLAISDGVTLLSGRNASNKSSLLRALAGVLGGPVPPVKNDADSGAVRLTVDGTEYALDLERRDGATVATRSDVYSSRDDPCELFVALTETNPIRQAILAGDDLYDLLMRPVDTAAIRSEIRRLRERKADLDDRLEELDAMESRLPELRTRRETLRERKERIEADLRAKRNEIEEREGDAGDVADDLQAKREERNDTRARIRTQEDAIESLSAELDDVTAELSSVEPTATDDGSIEDVSAELDRLHRRKQELTSTINALSPIVEMNSKLLDGDLPDAMTDDDVVPKLDPDARHVTCWTCGSTVEEAAIAEQIGAIEDLVREKRDQRDTITSRIQALTERRRELEDRAERVRQLRERRDDVESELEQRRAALDDLQTDLRRLESEIETLQRDAGDGEEDRLRELYDDVSDLEYERGRVATDLESVEQEVDELESRVATRESVAAERESVAADLRERRERIETVERDLVSTFNEMMQDVLDALEYDAVERIWLERRSEGPGDDATTFELHVVRAADDGAVYDDTVDSLSKSEREVIGLVVALAGYLVHDVGEAVPFLVVDAVEMFDADRIDGLMDLFDEHAEYVVAAVLPEEADELEEAYETVSTRSFAGTP